MQSALLLDNDLFFSVKVTDTLRHIGIQTRTVRRVDDFIQALASDQPLIALVNTAARGIDWQAGIIAASQAQVPCIAFGAHVDLATQEIARQAGATRVLSNSRLSSDLPGIVGRMLRAESESRIEGRGAATSALPAVAPETESVIPSPDERR